MVDFAKMLAERRARWEEEKRANESEPVAILACRPRRPNPGVSVGICGGDYSVKFPYDRKFLDDFKMAISARHRSWNGTLKAWIVAPEAIATAKQLIDQYWGISIDVPQLTEGLTQAIEKTFQVDYLGACKNRGDYSSSYASVNGQWAAEFPEETLRAFFNAAVEPNQPKQVVQTLYQILCVVETVDDQAIKSAYRRLARQWHPDVCREDNATDMFRQINAAYETLMIPEKRKRYDAGLYFERQAKEKSVPSGHFFATAMNYCPPLRCGIITAEGIVKLGRFQVTKIIKWDDVVNGLGQVMVSSWPAGSDSFITVWCDAGQSYQKGDPF